MKKITKFGVKDAMNLRTELEQAMKKIETRYGINISIGNSTYSPNNISYKITVSTVTESGIVKTKEYQDLERYFPDLVGKEIQINSGMPGKIIGLKRKNPRYPFIVMSEDGLEWTLSHRQVGIKFSSLIP